MITALSVEKKDNSIAAISAFAPSTKPASPPKGLAKSGPASTATSLDNVQSASSQFQNKQETVSSVLSAFGLSTAAAVMFRMNCLTLRVIFSKEGITSCAGTVSSSSGLSL